jgi:hypothetical protein
MEGAAGVTAETRVFSVVGGRDVVEDVKDEMGAGLRGDKVEVDLMEWKRGSETTHPLVGDASPR